jgi:hypothetical protein
MEAILEGKHSTYVQPKKARALKVNKAPEGEPGMAMSYLYQPGKPQRFADDLLLTPKHRSRRWPHQLVACTNFGECARLDDVHRSQVGRSWCKGKNRAHMVQVSLGIEFK